ncbi:MAG: tetratricopeptide repeat protein [Nitrosopumilus sp.]|nr:tetratricopeptide repeat protein [Nitrosopumilus sp.]
MALDPDERGAAPGHGKLREVEIHNEEAERLIRGGEYEAARRLLEPASGTAPGGARTVYNMAVLDDGAGMYYEAADRLDRLLESGRNAGDAPGAPGLDDILVLRGLVHAHEGNHESAIECYDRTTRAGNRPDAAYYMADSLYRLGRYEEAATWYGRAGGFRDAAKRRDDMSGMRTDVPDRLWIPLLAADAPGGISSMPRIQYITYLSQAKKASYDFGTATPGPYSEDLALDIARNTDLFKVDNEDGGASSPRRTYSLTSRGRELLGILRLDADTAARVRRCRDMDVLDLARTAHAMSDEHPNPGSLTREIREIIASAGDEDAYPGYGYGLVLMGARHARRVLSEMPEDSMDADRSAVLGISGIITYKCLEIIRHPCCPIDHYEAQRIIGDLAEYGSLLLKYAKTNKIVTYPAILNAVKRTPS